MTEFSAQAIDVQARDGHRWQLLAVIPGQPRARLFWLPAMGVAAKHYLPFSQGLAAAGIAVFIHDWRGNGSSSLRPTRNTDWGYRELLVHDLPASEAMAAQMLDGVPRIVGGHSLGGQLACCHLGMAPESASQLWLVASGSPYWRAFPLRTRWWLPMAYRFLPWLADRRGFLPGHSIGFGGNESRTLIHDWARSALSGRYAARGIDTDIETAMSGVAVEARAVTLAQDWLAPPTSTRYLLSKLPQSRHRIDTLDMQALKTRAGHFGWMKQPGPVIESLLRPV
ncbi:putative alpha/beta hydrolase [Lysobacter niabensis]|uniref:Alpha/beta hydrolase n=1 Tax=Agrilutibacter niabensis TaxID=380628 RepID=A0ABU1VNS2_9GAMM|nr:alpha/beta fold hydrolase [Lysobacter niabensis]MDR7099134.1 putative alpha/beta hydrolase [Lysobacter niabensis]